MNPDDINKNPELFIENKIKEFVVNNPENRLKNIDSDIIYDEPLVGFANGKDPLFHSYKEIIGSFHLTPEEVFQKLAPYESLNGLSVICWILPISEKTKASNRGENIYPSLRWAHTRTYGEEFNNLLRRYIVSLLKETGSTGIAPFISELFHVKWESSAGIASTWSERHIQYAAGLGTFSLNDGFITRKGMAMRCGSVVTNLKLKPSVRHYRNHTCNCLFLSKRSECRECVKRCPVGAITEKGHDKDICREYTYNVILAPLQEKYQVREVGCGLCQTGVPCESRIP